jgi:hypothetical protein
MTTTTRTTQEQLDYEALQEFIRLRDYKLVAQAVCCSRTTAWERVQRALERANPNNYPSNRSDFSPLNDNSG